jgi:hypothetical protein
LEYGNMNQDCVLARQMDMAQRELGAFLHVVAELYGPEAAAISVDDWLDELTLSDWVGEPTPSHWRLVTIAAASRLATRVNKQDVDKIA